MLHPFAYFSVRFSHREAYGLRLDKEIESCLPEIDDIRKTEDLLVHDLSFQGAAPSITASSRIGLMDSTVPVEAVVRL